MLLRATETQPAVRITGLDARAAFTLVEIILAIALATVLLLIAMTFYQQAAEMRGQILQESERFSTMRLALDHLAGDLRAAQPQASPGNEFTGDSNSMSFIKEACITPSSIPAPGTNDPSDLVRISLTTLISTNGTNIAVSGLDRTETPLVPPAVSPAPLTNSLDLGLFSMDQTNLTNQVTEPFADMVRFVRFRYWDGAAWQGGWTNASPPSGVEIVLATTRLPDDAEPDAFPPDAFRRVVFLPAGVTRPAPDAGAATNLVSAR